MVALYVGLISLFIFEPSVMQSELHVITWSIWLMLNFLLLIFASIPLYIRISPVVFSKFSVHASILLENQPVSSWEAWNEIIWSLDCSWIYFKCCSCLFVRFFTRRGWALEFYWFSRWSGCLLNSSGSAIVLRLANWRWSWVRLRADYAPWCCSISVLRDDLTWLN